MKDLDLQHEERMSRAEAQRIEEEAKIWLDMGYKPEELILVIHPGEISHIQPKDQNK